MKLIISEKQLQQLVKMHAKSQELSEDGEEGAPEAGTSSDGEKKTGMPKWESGINRGPANQIAVTRWKDIDGVTPARGKANTLWEQNLLVPANSEDAENQAKAMRSFWDDWGQWILMGGSILVATFVPGAQGLWISIGLDLVAAVDLYANKKDNYGAGISTVLAFIPYIGNVAKIGKVSVQTAERLARLLAPLKTEKEVLKVVSKLSKQDQYIVQQILKQDPKTLNNTIKKLIQSRVTTKKEAIKIAKQINSLVKSGKLPKASAEAFYKNLNLKRFGFDIAASGLVVISGESLRYYFNIKKANEMLEKGISLPANVKEVVMLAKKVKTLNENDFNNRIVPIFDNYRKIYDNDNATEEQLNKFVAIQKTLLLAYLKNPKQDLSKVTNTVTK